MYRLFMVLVAASLFLHGCTPDITLKPSTESGGTTALKNKPLYTVHYETPKVQMIVPNAAGQGLIGFMLTAPAQPGISADEVMRQHNVADVTARMKFLMEQKLLSYMSDIYSTNLTRDLPMQDDYNIYQSRFQNGYVLEVSTLSHMLAAQPLAWTTYDYRFHSAARVIDTESSQVIWGDTCVIGPGHESGTAIERAQLNSDNAEIFRAMVEKAAQYCAGVFSSGFMHGTVIAGK